MAQINISSDFKEQVTNLGVMNSFNISEGSSSVINAYMASKSIVLADDIAAGVIATVHDTNKDKYEKEAHKYYELSRNNSNDAFSVMYQAGQVLKSTFAPDFGILGDWGFRIDGNGKIIKPIIFADKVQLFTDMKTKHDTYSGSTSPLHIFLTTNDIDLTALETSLHTAVGNYQLFNLKKTAATSETELRNNAWRQPLKNLKLIKNYLAKLYINSPRTLGDYGIPVTEVVTKEKEQVSSIQLLSIKTIRGIVMGSTVENISKIDLWIHIGKGISDNPIKFLAGSQHGIQKGQTQLTFQNTNELINSKVKCLVKRS